MVCRRDGGEFWLRRSPDKRPHPSAKFPIPLRLRPRLLLAAALIPCLLAGSGLAQTWRQARPGYRLQFPRDHANHPEYRIGWWY